jgi:hypothetical protein
MGGSVFSTAYAVFLPCCIVFCIAIRNGFDTAKLTNPLPQTIVLRHNIELSDVSQTANSNALRVGKNEQTHRLIIHFCQFFASSGKGTKN